MRFDGRKVDMAFLELADADAPGNPYQLIHVHLALVSLGDGLVAVHEESRAGRPRERGVDRKSRGSLITCKLRAKRVEAEASERGGEIGAIHVVLSVIDKRIVEIRVEVRLHQGQMADHLPKAA